MGQANAILRLFVYRVNINKQLTNTSHEQFSVCLFSQSLVKCKDTTTTDDDVIYIKKWTLIYTHRRRHKTNASTLWPGIVSFFFSSLTPPEPWPSLCTCTTKTSKDGPGCALHRCTVMCDVPLARYHPLLLENRVCFVLVLSLSSSSVRYLSRKGRYHV